MPSVAVTDTTGWRRTGVRYFALICALIFAVTAAVHRHILVQDQSSLPIATLVASLEQRHCPPAAQAALLHSPPLLRRQQQGGERGSTATAAGGGLVAVAQAEGERQPLAAAYGVGVWFDFAAVLPAARAVLEEIDARLSAPAALGEPSSATDTAAALLPHSTAEREERYLFPFFRHQHQLRDDFLAAHSSGNSRNNSAISLRPFASEAAALASLRELAEEQQLGMAALRFSFAPELGAETHMVGLSLFHMPAELFPFIADPIARPTLCRSFDTRQSFCVFLTGSGGAAEVRAAVSSVLAADLRIDSFRTDDVARWHSVRATRGCAFAVRSLRTLLASIAASPDMTIPFAVHAVFDRLQALVEGGRLVRAARAADDLQFEPLLTPQMYMPMDHSLLSQLLILLPVLSMALLGVRFVLEERKLQRRRAAKAAAMAAGESDTGAAAGEKKKN